MTAATGRARDPVVDSQWWYWVALTPLYAGSVLVFALGIASVVLLGETADYAMFLPAALALTLLGFVFGVAFPVALYRDADAVGDAAPDWQPNGRRYALAAVVAVVGSCFLGTVPLAAYYLYRRHTCLGVP
ncbi:hypothetical protein [Halobacterium zhouii]|uniref:hypothetical protein n=1 Tax=Halobacterium zhouii TaxID=2902624 RepID=UPI001E3E621E|nr:hypothetical protein [Halobacterium zhouii]